MTSTLKEPQCLGIIQQQLGSGLTHPCSEKSLGNHRMTVIDLQITFSSENLFTYVRWTCRSCRTYYQIQEISTRIQDMQSQHNLIN